MHRKGFLEKAYLFLSITGIKHMSNRECFDDVEEYSANCHTAGVRGSDLDLTG